MEIDAIITSIGKGICYGHNPPIPMTGVVITGSPNVKSGNQQTAYVTSIVLGNCGHTGTIIDGSLTVKTNNLNKARVGSNFIGTFTGVIISGFNKVLVGG